jgi:hypothetical protein
LDKITEKVPNLGTGDAGLQGFALFIRKLFPDILSRRSDAKADGNPILH